MHFWTLLTSSTVGLRRFSMTYEDCTGLAVGPAEGRSDGQTGGRRPARPASVANSSPGGGSAGAAPYPRCCHAAVYDEDAGEMLIFGGGRFQQTDRDCHRYCFSDGSWARHSLTAVGGSTGPLPCRLAHTAVRHAGSVYLFGGLHETSVDPVAVSLRDMTWRTLPAPAASDDGLPAPRQSHSAFVYEGEMWVAFGVTTAANGVREFLSDVWALRLDAAAPVWRRVRTTRKGTAAVSASTDGGGGSGGSPPDEKLLPRAREGHSFTLDAEGGSAYLFGGRAGGALHAGGVLWTSAAAASREVWLNDVWQLDLRTREWRLLHGGGGDHRSVPPGRCAHHAWLVGPQALYVFGGDAVTGVDDDQWGDAVQYFNDVWRFDLAACSWTRVRVPGDVPSPRSGHVGVVHKGALHVHGGELPMTPTYMARYSSSMFALHFPDPAEPLRLQLSKRLVGSVLSLTDAEFVARCRDWGVPERIVHAMLLMKPWVPLPGAASRAAGLQGIRGGPPSPPMASKRPRLAEP